MPSLERKTVEVQLPSFGDDDPAYIKVYSKIISADLDGIDTSDTSSSVFHIYARVISEWNLTDNDGNLLPITAENIKQLPVDDLDAIANQTDIKRQLDNLKKNN